MSARTSAGLPWVPNHPTPNPGHTRETVASNAQNVVRIEATHTPTMPNGTR